MIMMINLIRNIKSYFKIYYVKNKLLIILIYVIKWICFSFSKNNLYFIKIK